MRSSRELKVLLEEWAGLLRSATIQQAKGSFYIEDPAAEAYTCTPIHEKVIAACAVGVYGLAHKMSVQSVAALASDLPSWIQAQVFHMNDYEGKSFGEIADYLQKEADKL